MSPDIIWDSLTLDELQDIRDAADRELLIRAGLVGQATAELHADSRRLAVEDGCVDQAVVDYSDHKRARNWVATVARDRTAPGGLARTFWARGSGSWAKVPSDLKADDVIEVASDYYSGSGRKSAGRHYFRVLAVAPDQLVLITAENPAA